ncbi:DUF6089 family protein [Chryseolinea sp. T2]|uniref:DUF6089 family protein n=1 Tax=Chryseolinea sp. T2 TaxID=3129255 RepID=UPI0030771D7F
MRRFFQVVVAVLFVSLVFDAEAQVNRRTIKKNNHKMATYRGRKSWFGKEKRYDMLGIGISALNYYGDLSPKPGIFSTDITFTKPAIALSYSHRFGPRYAISASFMYGALKGSDKESADPGDAENGTYRYTRNLSFRNRIKELSVVASIDLFDNSMTYISRVDWTPYVFAGASVFMHNPQAQAPATDLNGNPLPEAGQWIDLRDLGTEGQHSQLLETDVNYGIKPYKNIQLAIPMGIGARFKLNEVMDLSVEWGFRYLFTDYIDDVSRHYVDLGVFGGNELAKAMSYRSNEVATPTYTYVGRDGKSYSVVPGYGSEFKDNNRGSKNDRDIFMVTTFKLTYVLGKSMHRAKFR